MTIAYLFLVSAACILIAMAIESLLKSTSILNMATALLLFTASIIIGSEGLEELFLLGNSRLFTLIMIRTYTAALSFLGFSFFFFSNHFPRDKKINNNYRLILFFLVITLIFVILNVFGLDINKYDYIINDNKLSGKILDIRLEYNLMHWVMSGFSIALSVYSIIQIGFKYNSVKLIYQKKQIRYFISGLLFFVFLLVFERTFKIFLPEAVSYLIISLAFITTGASLLYSVISYRFYNLRMRIVILFRDFTIGILITVFLTSLLLVIRGWMAIIHPLFYFIIMAPGLILFFWLYYLSMNLIKKIFNFENENRDITEVFLDRIGSSHNVYELAQKAIYILIENINCRNADFLFFEKESDIFKVIYSSNNRNYEISAIDPFFRRITPETEIYDREIINFDPRFSNIRDIAERYFENYEASLIIPVFYDKNLIVLINIASKLDNNSYTNKELELMNKLKKIIQIIVNNIILFDKEQEAKITKRDLNLASEIQESIFQKFIPEFDNIDVFGYEKPALEVSGDYFLIQKTGDHKLGVLIADVSGKGFSAALVSMVIHTIAKSQEFSSVSTNAIVSKINEVLTSSQYERRLTKTMSFATIFCGFIDNSIKTLFYTNAGHYPMIIYNILDKSFESLKANSKPAGIFVEEQFIIDEYQFDNNSIFILYSDGITEAINNNEQEFGLERLQNIIKINSNKSAKEITDLVICEVEVFTEGKEQFDDITLIVIKL